MRHSFALTVTMATLVITPAFAQDGGAPGKLSKLIPNLMNLAEVPGLSIATIEDGKVRWIGSFGVKDTKTGEEIDGHTVFPAASLSKVVFAYAVLKLVDKGELDLDVPLSKYAPAYVENDDRGDLNGAPRLTHRTGFPNWRPRGKPLVIHFNPGERFSYSGEGFVRLQHAVEKIAGQPLDVFMKKTVFIPLEITDSSYLWQEKYEDQAVAGHSEAGVPAKLRKTVEGASPINGAGGPAAASTLLTTAADYAKFVIAVMNGTGLKRETALQMLTPQSGVDAGSSNCIRKPLGRTSESISWGARIGSGADASRPAVLALGRQRRFQSVRHRVGSIQARRRGLH